MKVRTLYFLFVVAMTLSACGNDKGAPAVPYEDTNAVEQTDDATEQEKPDSNLVGKWYIGNTIAKESGFILIVKKDDEGYYSYEGTIECRLKKKGDKYYKIGDSRGEYYIINGDNVRLCDSEGDFTESSGYTVRKIGKW